MLERGQSYSVGDQTVTGRASFDRARSGVDVTRYADLPLQDHVDRLNAERVEIERLREGASSYTAAAIVFALLALAVAVAALVVTVRPSWTAEYAALCEGLICEPGAVIDLVNVRAWVVAFGLSGVAVLAAALACKRQKAARTALVRLQTLAFDMRTWRAINPGSGFMRFGLGDAGIQITGQTRTLAFEWSGFDKQAFKAVNPGAASVFLIQPSPYPKLDDLDTHVAANGGGAVDTFLTAARAWAPTVNELVLPLKISAEALDAVRRAESARLNRPATSPLPASAVAWTEYVIVQRHFFQTHEDATRWERWVELALYLLARSDR